MEKKKRNLVIGAVAAVSVATLGNIQAKNSTIEANILGSGAEVRNELLSNRGIAKMLNDLKCGENKSDAKTDKTKGKEGKCGEKKAKGKEGKCGEGKCGEKKAKGKEGKCGEGKCGEKKTKEQPK
ncbi:MAG: hypothetical protein KatS3mg028_0910 [Bacteroidia bacterium]|nr:MAG: hypothetical protein KatS3mg028_0910 [Bacteroidia bacterium]